MHVHACVCAHKACAQPQSWRLWCCGRHTLSLRSLSTPHTRPFIRCFPPTVPLHASPTPLTQRPRCPNRVGCALAVSGGSGGVTLIAPCPTASGVPIRRPRCSTTTPPWNVPADTRNNSRHKIATHDAVQHAMHPAMHQAVHHALHHATHHAICYTMPAGTSPAPARLPAPAPRQPAQWRPARAATAHPPPSTARD